jgi:hypothetical protein
MRKFMTVVSIVSVLLCAEPSSAQQRRDFLRRAEVQRVGGMLTCVANYPRPLEQVLDAVSEEYGWSIDYEDPPYQSSFELIDDTDPQWRAANPTAAGVRRVRGGSFRATYAESAVTATSAKEKAIVIGKVVADYNASGNPGQFAIREPANGHLEIVGTSVKDEGGAQLRITPILDTPVTVQSASMNAEEAVAAILSALSIRTGTKVVPATQPTNLMMQTTVKVSGTEMSARDALHEVLSQAKIRLYWRLLYDADSQTYYFNVEMAKRVQYDTFGKRQLVLIH